MPEGCPAGLASTSFQIRTIVEVEADRTEVDPQQLRGGAGDLGVGVRGLTQSMVDVHCGDTTVGSAGEGDERRRVGATGERAGDRGVCRRKGAPAEEIGGVEQDRCLGRATRYRSVWWADRCPRLGCCLEVTDPR